MTLSEHRRLFTLDVARLILWVDGSLPGFALVIHEVARTEYQQREYVRTGASWTMNSDHLEARAADFVLYRVGADGSLDPTWDVRDWRPIGEAWVALDPDYNYWGYAEWGKDAPHFGRWKEPRQDDGGGATA